MCVRKLAHTTTNKIWHFAVCAVCCFFCCFCLFVCRARTTIPTKRPGTTTTWCENALLIQFISKGFLNSKQNSSRNEALPRQAQDKRTDNGCCLFVRSFACCLFVCLLSVRLFACSFVCVFVCLFACLLACLFACSFVCFRRRTRAAARRTFRTWKQAGTSSGSGVIDCGNRRKHVAQTFVFSAVCADEFSDFG